MPVLTVLLETCGLVGFTWWLLSRYRDPHVSTLAIAAVFLSWLLGFLGLLLLPIDMARHSPVDADQDDIPVFHGIWQALYWTTFVLSWALLPLLVEFTQNGEFQLDRRLASSLRRLLFHWSVVVAVGTAVMLYLLFIGHFTAQGLLGFAMAAANTYGLVWLIVLLGFGLVEIPRSLWMKRYPAIRLRGLYFRASQIHNERMEAIFLYEDVVRETRASYDRMLEAESASIVLTSDMQMTKTNLTHVLTLIQAEGRDGGAVKSKLYVATPSSPRKSTRSSSSQLAITTAPTPSEVVDLHRRVKAAQADLRGSEQAWVELCVQAEALAQQVKLTDGDGSGSERAAPPVGLFSTSDVSGQLRNMLDAVAHILQRVVLPPLYAFISLIAALGSLSILWSELTMSWSSKFSLFHLVAPNLDDQAATTELLSFGLLCYLVLCAYSSLFKLRSFGKFALRGHRNSSDLALLKTSIQQCRLQFALSYNFLLLVHQPQLTDTTAFHRLWNHMQVIHVLGRDFSVYTPALMVVLVICTLGNIYARVMKNLIGMEQYEQLIPGNVEHEAQIRKGEQLIQKGLEKQRRELVRRRSSRGYGYSTSMAQALLDGSEEGGDDAAA
ncbi:hypothetical protein Poli38472_014101 [Pythium oligandrum]|uniref:LMBR1-like membrane protein n=1 Tax=Pythium oligandrum TaxID=41045 RepID=A0A8K1CNL7_PYTOL|nr:hypothetical protein Poli38472_014101 [Pythium oligandrum]|eukprot:TMW66789.1 hypothetical protein Poli38472_014101 [Pythium oligandrum]